MRIYLGTSKIFAYFIARSNDSKYLDFSEAIAANPRSPAAKFPKQIAQVFQSALTWRRVYKCMFDSILFSFFFEQFRLNRIRQRNFDEFEA